MRREEVNYIVAGGFVILMVAIFLITLIALTGRSGPTDTYLVHYSNVAGMKFGTVVSYQGYRIGQVEDIEPIRSARGVRYRVG